MREYLFKLIFISILLACFVSGVGTAAGGDDINVKYTLVSVDKDAETATIRARVTIPRRVTSVTFSQSPQIRRVDSTFGFTRTSDGFEWNGETNKPSFTYTVDLQTVCAEDDLAACTVSSNETMVDMNEVSGFFIRFRYSSLPVPDIDESYSTSSGTAIGPFVLSGDVDIEKQSVDNTEVRVADQGNVTADELNVVTTTERELDVAGGVSQKTVIVAPDGVRDGGLAYTKTAWVGSSPEDYLGRSLWIHEYFHLNQRAELGPRMVWYTEASADYYGDLLAVRQRSGSFLSFYAGSSTSIDSNKVLSSSDTRESYHYTKGQRVIAALDAKIRKDTAGQKDFEMVVKRMNTYDGTVTLQVFKNIVSDVAGENYDSWINKYVTTSAVPPVPKNSSLYGDTTGNADTDGDELPDSREFHLGANPFDADTDSDSLNDSEEFIHGASPTNSDTDNDGIRDGREVSLLSEPASNDTDGDGLNDGRELSLETLLVSSDTDDDGLSDYRETVKVKTEAVDNDTDSDGLTDYQEVVEYRSDPTVNDTDGDGVSDGEKVRSGTSPVSRDTDDDGLEDEKEISDPDLSPTTNDTDGDRLSDQRELYYNTNASNNDSDGDTITDRREVQIGTSPTSADTDNDGLTDSEELNGKTEPLSVDTDGDMLSDRFERRIGSDPTKTDTDTDGVADSVDPGRVLG